MEWKHVEEILLRTGCEETRWREWSDEKNVISVEAWKGDTDEEALETKSEDFVLVSNGKGKTIQSTCQ